jgi:dienelactone hydrolase
LRQFEQQLLAQGTETQIFTYVAEHGFFAFSRSSYNAEAAQLAWQRAANFFRRTPK